VITTDDDVTAPPEWLERLVAPFVSAEVMIVTGNVLPLELATPAQLLFEAYGGLGRGFNPRNFNREWFDRFKTAVPTWELGGTANAAFRATIFENPDIGLMDEALGPGMPSGVGEDTYLFYKALKAGHTVVYEPAAYIWHRHRREVSALRRQLYGYSKGHVAYHLTTLLSDHDLRGLIYVMLRLPPYHLRRIRACLRRRSNYPLSLVMLEIAGNLVGPLALWRSRRRVQREGRSAPYVPVARRSARLSKGGCE
jgi:GT2 family glycosyltransferase